MTDFESLKKIHREHLESAARKGGPGRACTAPAVSQKHLDDYAPLLGSLDVLTRAVVEQLVQIVKGAVPAPSVAELNKLDSLLDTIQGTELRNSVFHIFWHAKELACGRTPQ